MSKKNKPISAKKGKPSKQGTDKGQSISKRDILRIARLVFEQNDGRVLTYKQVCHAFGKTNMGQKRAIYQTLVSMAEGGEIQELEPGRFVRGGLSKERLEGRFDYRAGRASFIPDDPEIDTLPLSDRALANALHGDRVAVSFVRTRRGEYKRVQVVEILRAP